MRITVFWALNKFMNRCFESWHFFLVLAELDQICKFVMHSSIVYMRSQGGFWLLYANSENATAFETGSKNEVIVITKAT